MSVSPTAILVEFARLVATAEPEEILEALSLQAVKGTVAEGAAVIRIEGDSGLSVVCAQGCSLKQGPLEFDSIGPELTSGLLAASTDGFEDARAFPLVASSNLFGVLVVFQRSLALSEEDGQLLSGLADLAATTLERTYQYKRLLEAYDTLEVSKDVLARAERLRALGQLSASVAHDLRNLLNPLFMQVALIKRVEGVDVRVTRSVERMEQTLRRGLEVVDRLRRVGSREGAPVELADLNALVEEALEIAQPITSRRPEVRLSWQPGPTACVRVERTELVSAIVNLVNNAREAIEGEGVIDVRTHVSEARCQLEIRDTGCGMTEDVRRRLFEPFFTTKGTKGTGLGLTAVVAFVERSGGSLRVRSRPGTGSCFTIDLPRARQETVAQEAEQPDTGTT